MRKLTLDLDQLTVQSFPTTKAAVTSRGTVYGNAPTAGRNTRCGSIYDACPTVFGCPTIGCNDTVQHCEETYDCESANDACPSGRGCTLFC